MSVKGVPFGYWLLANAALTFPLPVREFQALLWHTIEEDDRNILVDGSRLPLRQSNVSSQPLQDLSKYKYY